MFPGLHEEGVISEEGVRGCEWRRVNGCGIREWKRLVSGGSEDGARTVSGLEHLVLLLCGLADDLSGWRSPVRPLLPRSLSPIYCIPRQQDLLTPFRVGNQSPSW